MKIESIIKRAKGHSVELGENTYEFLPPDYLAEVENPDHIGRLLSIVEGYRAVGAGANVHQLKPAASHVVVDYLLSDVHPSEFEINGKTYSQADVVKLAAGECTAEVWNALDEGERADAIDEQLDKLESGLDAGVLYGSTVHPTEIDLGEGRTIMLGDLVQKAFEQSGKSTDEWNALADGERNDLIEAMSDTLKADTNNDGVVDNAEERAALVKNYEAKFGKKPHGKWTVARIREELAKAGE